MKQAVDLALAPDGNARVQIARELIPQSEARVKQARAALLPNLEASVVEQNFTRNLRAFGVQAPSSAFSFPEIVGPISTFDARGTVTQSIFDFAAIKRHAATRAGVELAKAEEESSRNAVSDQVARAYLALMRADAAIEAARANVALAESLRRLAASQRDLGTGTGIEVTRAQVQLANEQQRLLLAGNDRSRAEVSLLRAIGLSPDTRVELSDKLVYAPQDSLTEEEARRSAHETRADWRAQQRRESVSKLNFDAVKWERLPSVTAFADAGGIGLEPAESRYTRAFGVSVRLPIWDGGRRDARRADSAAQLRIEQIRGKDLSEQIDAEVRLAWDGLQSADGQVGVADQGLKLAENELAQARRRYEAGVGTSLEVTDAQSRLARSRDNRTAALYLHNLAKIELASAMGAIHKVIQ